MTTNNEELKDKAENIFEETVDKVGDKAEALWKQLQAKTGFSDQKIDELKAKASTKIEDLKAEMETWDDEAKEKWAELKGKAGTWWSKIKDEFDGENENDKQV
jgi:ElaB/YqjD/DUF883 family membrane-anchored ribosome-binding protein